MDISTHTPNGVEKTTRYGWTMVDEPGEFRMVHKDRLQIHPAYQRDLQVNKVKEITANWSWIGLGVLVVCERGGELWVADGQHRAVAAKRRSDINELPCMIFKTPDVKTEARAFLTVNTGRKPVTAISKQKALVAAGVAIAIYVQQTCDVLGLEIRSTARTAGTINCIAWCAKRAKDSLETFDAVLEIGAELSTKDDMPVAEKLLEGLWYLNARCGDGLKDKRLVKRLREKGGRLLLDAATRAAAYTAAAGGKIWAEGMLAEINKGLQRKFTMGAVEA